MNDRVLAQSLRAGDPGALAAVYDHCADDLFQYCWFMLRDREAARVALRDTLVVAQAHIGRLKDPGLVSPWLYALARVERRRRRPAPPDHPDVTVAPKDEAGADLRLVAWNAVMALPAAQREALYLSVRRGLTPAWVARVLGLPGRDAEGLIERSRRSLEQGVIGEVLARAGDDKCSGRAAILRGRRGVLTAAQREDLARHAAGCKACSRRVPHRVSADKVFGVLPVAEPLPGMRLRTMTFLTDPELAGYRALAAKRAGRFDGSGFPIQDRRRGPERGTPRAGLWVGLASGAAAVVAGAVFALGSLGRFDTGAAPAQQAVPVVPVPGGAQVPDASSGWIPGRAVTPISPLGTVLRPRARSARQGSQLFTLGGQSLLAGGPPGRGGRQPGGAPAPSAPPAGSRPPGQPHPTPASPSSSPPGSPAPSPSPTRTPTPSWTSTPSQTGGPTSSTTPSPRPSGTSPAPSAT